MSFYTQEASSTNLEALTPLLPPHLTPYALLHYDDTAHHYGEEKTRKAEAVKEKRTR